MPKPKVTWAYDWDIMKLLDEFDRNCSRGGQASIPIDYSILKGVDSAGSNPFQLGRYLKGVLRARILGKIPPFKRGDKVTVTDAVTCISIDSAVGGVVGEYRKFMRFDDEEQSIVFPKDRLTIDRIWFNDDDNWYVEFTEIKYPRIEGRPVFPCAGLIPTKS